MYVRVTPLSFDPTREQEFIRFNEEHLIPAVRQLPGFHRYIGAGDRTTGRGVAITEWDDLQHAQVLRNALGGLVQEVADLGVHLEDPQVYEVLVQS
jgi:hypothetical protein